LGGDDLALLAKAVAKPRFELPRRETLAQMEQMATRLDAKHGVMRARSAALGAPAPLMRLSQRAEATQEPAFRRRAHGRVTLGAIGSGRKCRCDRHLWSKLRHCHTAARRYLPGRARRGRAGGAVNTATRFNLGRARTILELNRNVLEERARALLGSETLEETKIARLRARLRAVREFGRAA